MPTVPWTRRASLPARTRDGCARPLLRGSGVSPRRSPRPSTTPAVVIPADGDGLGVSRAVPSCRTCAPRSLLRRRHRRLRLGPSRPRVQPVPRAPGEPRRRPRHLPRSIRPPLSTTPSAQRVASALGGAPSGRGRRTEVASGSTPPSPRAAPPDGGRLALTLRVAHPRPRAAATSDPTWRPDELGGPPGGGSRARHAGAARRVAGSRTRRWPRASAPPRTRHLCPEHRRADAACPPGRAGVRTNRWCRPVRWALLDSARTKTSGRRRPWSPPPGGAPLVGPARTPPAGPRP